MKYSSASIQGGHRFRGVGAVRVWLFLDEPTYVYTLIGGAILLLARAGSEPTEWNKAQASASYMRIQQQ